jgi:deltex-like protein
MNGLLTRSEREANQIHTRFNGDSLGDGVYTGNNPFAFHKFKHSDVGILVARLRGQTGTRTDQDGVDTAVKRPGTFSETVVPGSSCQCVALVSFSSALISQIKTTRGSDLIHEYHCQLQEVVDEIFNGGKMTDVPKVIPEEVYGLNTNQARGALALPTTIYPPPWNSESMALDHIKAYQQGGSLLDDHDYSLTLKLQADWDGEARLQETRPSVRPAVGTEADSASVPPLPAGPVLSRPARSLVAEVVLYTAPQNFNTCYTTDNTFGELTSPLSECSICLDGACTSKGAVSLTVCGHQFHKACIVTALQFSKRCPVCRKWVGSKPQGAMPTGTMKIRQDPTITCSGSDPGAIIIDYSLGCNVQKVYHPNPGTPHGSASRRAFLPDNTDGRNLLKRLKYAFQHGLTFCVGTSLTTGMPNVITWSSIHHKTRLARGPHDYSDHGYFINSNEELDALGVPAADNL